MSIYNRDNIIYLYDLLSHAGKIMPLKDNELEKLFDKQNELKKEIKKLKKSGDSSSKELIGHRWRELKSSIEKKKEELLNPVVKDVMRGEDVNIDGPTDCAGNIIFKCSELRSALSLQLVKEDIKCHYKVSVANRDEVVKSLKMVLRGTDNKILIRTDIRSFFENISLAPIIAKLTHDSYISPISLKILRNLEKNLKNKIEDKNLWLPRGLSISSHLAELRMEHFDRKVRQLRGVYYYRRYVDDIVMVANPNVCSAQDLLSQLKVIAKEQYLPLHEEGDKTKVVEYNKQNQDARFEYLGYKFIGYGSSLQINLSEKRKERYISRIDAVFRFYNENATRRKMRPLRKLFDLMTALTGNGMMIGGKKMIPVGVYYSNRHITTMTDLQALDAYLHEAIESKFLPSDRLFNYPHGDSRENSVARIKEVLRQRSFCKGFEEQPALKCNMRYINALKLLKKISCEQE